MAKWGEGDPRWIVEERPDATNVNNWHWSDKDASSWSENKLQALLVGLVFDGPEGSCETTEVVSVTGEATVNNRKGKLIYLYDWHLKLKWTGTPLDSDIEFKGEIEIPNLGDEHDIDDVDVTVTSDKTSDAAENLKALVHRMAPDIVREQLMEYIRCLKEEYSQGLIKPSQSQGCPPQRDPSPIARPTNRQNSLTTTSSASKPSGSGIGYRIPTTKLTLTEFFMASVQDLYNTLTSQELVEAFTRGKATVEPRKGGSYSILGGEITGEFVQLEKPTRIVQKWRGKSWPVGHHSMVTMDLKQENDGTKLVLTQTEVPESDLEWTREGWKRYIFESIKSTFGYGARLF